MRLFRDPVARALGGFASAFRRSRGRDVGALETGSFAEPVKRSGWRTTLERFRGGLVFGLLALGVICVLEAMQHPDNPVAGLAELLVSWEGPVFLIGIAAIVSG